MKLTLLFLFRINRVSTCQHLCQHLCQHDLTCSCPHAAFERLCEPSRSHESSSPLHPAKVLMCGMHLLRPDHLSAKVTGKNDKMTQTDSARHLCTIPSSCRKACCFSYLRKVENSCSTTQNCKHTARCEGWSCLHPTLHCCL